MILRNSYGVTCKRPCEVCGQSVAHIGKRPVASHRRGRFHQAALAKAKRAQRESEAGR